MNQKKELEITKPTLVVDKDKVMRNLERMRRKISASPGNIRFRPHFKTHQSVKVGQWFREAGITAIAVSSLDMADYFAENGWTDITVAVLINRLQIDQINRLARQINLNVLVDTPEAATFLEKHLDASVGVYIKIDTGYHRTGVGWEQRDLLHTVAETVSQSSKLKLKGILTHAGHTYDADCAAEIRQVYRETVSKLQYVQDYLTSRGFKDLEISYGDTPACSIMEEFTGIDELRPGNFIYYDVMQLELDACREEDLAAAVFCPVIACYPQRHEFVIYGGAVHLSKEGLTDEAGTYYGLVAQPLSAHTWGASWPDTHVAHLSQEHGVIKTTAYQLKKICVGDLVAVLPIHSCLTANLLK